MRPIVRIPAIAGIAAAAACATLLPAGPASGRSFPADSHIVSLNQVYKTNVWTMEIDRARFAYELVRVGTDRRFRVQFDLTRPVPAPPAPWDP